MTLTTGDRVVTDSDWDHRSSGNSNEYECNERRSNAHNDRGVQSVCLLKTLENLEYDLQRTLLTLLYAQGDEMNRGMWKGTDRALKCAVVPGTRIFRSADS